MSQFYMARDHRTGNVVGLKVLDAEKTALFEARFRGLKKPTEGQIATALDHPRIVKTIEHGLTTSGQQYLLMEYLDGPGLNALILAQSPLLEGNRVALIRQMAEAVGAVHEAGFIHRDICPRNFICTPDATSLKLIDFGLTVPATKHYMLPGNRTGTPNHMAPEIVRRRNTDLRVDIFALGVTMYELSTFAHPWPSGDTSGRAAMLHDTHAPVEILEIRPRLNRVLAQTIKRCLAVNPDDRPASADELLQALRKVDSEEEASAKG